MGQNASAAESAAEPKDEIVAFKGFGKNLACRGYQYRIGETFEHAGRVEACAAGFHSCENPLDVWSYYGPAASRFATVRVSGSIARHSKDSKIASAKLTVEAELLLPDFIERAAEWIVGAAKGNTATGDNGHAAATGDNGHAAATGHRGNAAATGDNGNAAATGHRGNAAATGDNGHAAATGYRGNAAATGDNGHAAATGYRGNAAATGDNGHAAATGYRGNAAATGDNGHAAATGDSSISAALGVHGTALAGPSGAIMLAHYDTNKFPYRLTRVGAFMVGEHGVEAGKTYRLGADGLPVEVSA